MPDVFLSYSHNDRAAVQRFAVGLEAQGLDVWWDNALRSGEAFDEKIEQALREAKAVVVLWSNTSVVSRWVRAEATLADRKGKLVPVMLEACERPIMFELTHTVDLSQWRGDVRDDAWLGFIGEVQRFLGTERAPSPQPVPSAHGFTAFPRERERMLAVLPFDNLSSDEEMQFFSDGVSDEIMGRIARGSKLKVIGRTSSFQFRGARKAEAAAALNATHVLDGSIRRSGARVRVTAHLVEATMQMTLWTDRYDRGLEDIFAVQDEISEAIAEALDLAFFPPETRPINPADYDLYLRGKDFVVHTEGLDRCIALLKPVTERAPGFADAWGSLAYSGALLRMQLPYADRPELSEAVAGQIAQCRALDPENPRAAVAQWMLLDPYGDFLRLERAAKDMAKFGANDVDAQFSLNWHAENVGRVRDATGHARRCMEVDSLNWLAGTAFGQTLWRCGQYNEGRDMLQQTLARRPEDHHTAAALLVACMHAEDWDAAAELTDPRRLARNPLREHSGLVRLVATMRDRTPENCAALIGSVSRRLDQTGHMDTTPAVWLSHLGFVDEAYDMLERARLGPAGGPNDVVGLTAYRPHLLFPVAYPELRANPRFVKLCARLGLVEYWLETQNWPDCVDEVPYDFKAECEAYRDYAKDRFGS